jgi:nucleoside phosphorylase/WD40 repeat protein
METSKIDPLKKSTQPSYKAVILTAIHKEFEAIESCLNLQDTQIVYNPDGSKYHNGKVELNGHIWEIYLGETGQGNVASAKETERIITFIKPIHPDIALFVGIARSLKDVKLGDVAISTDVFYYESGKIDGEMKSRPKGFNVNYLMKKITDEVIYEEKWVKRIIAKDKRDSPKAQAGVIISGEKLVGKIDESGYEWIQKDYSHAIALEMEGYGFLDVAISRFKIINALVIRGISDHGDKKDLTDKQGFQEIAAAHASAFAVEVLAKYGDCISRHPALKDSTALKTIQHPEEESINPIEEIYTVSKEYFDLQCSDLKEFVGRDWLFERINKFFKSDTRNIYLLVEGKGFGKTAISCNSRGKISNCVNVHICNRAVSRTCDSIFWINSIIKELSNYSTIYKDYFNRKIKSQPEKLEEDSVDYFSHFFDDLPRPDDKDTYYVFVLDGLDEAYAYNSNSTRGFHKLFQYAIFPSYIKIFATTRPEHEEIGGEKTKPHIKRERIRENLEMDKWNKGDVRQFIQNRIQTISNLNEGEKNKYLNILDKKADGNFLYAKVVLDDIQDSTEYSISFKNLDKIPEDLFGLYKEMFDNRFTQRGTYYPPTYNNVKILLTILCSNKSIPIELIETFQTQKKIITSDLEWNILKQFLDKKSSEYSLFHESFKEWLLSPIKHNYSLFDSFKEINQDICNICFDNLGNESIIGVYSRRYLFYHLVNAGDCNGASSLLLNLKYIVLKLESQEYYELLEACRKLLHSITDVHIKTEIGSIFNFLVNRSHVLIRNVDLVKQEIKNYGPECIHPDNIEMKGMWLKLENKYSFLYKQTLDNHKGPIKKLCLIGDILFVVGTEKGSNSSGNYISIWNLSTGKYHRVNIKSDTISKFRSFCTDQIDDKRFHIWYALEPFGLVKIEYDLTKEIWNSIQNIPIGQKDDDKTNIKFVDLKLTSDKLIVCHVNEYSSHGFLEKEGRVKENPKLLEHGVKSNVPGTLRNSFFLIFDTKKEIFFRLSPEKKISCFEIFKENILFGCNDGSIGKVNFHRLLSEEINNPEIRFLKIHDNSKVTAILIRSGGFAESSDELGNIHKWIIEPFTDIKIKYTLHEEPNRRTIFSLVEIVRDGNTYLIAGGVGSIYILKENGNTKEIFRTIPYVHKSAVTSLCIWKNSGQFLISGSNDKTIKIWDIDDLIISEEVEKANVINKMKGSANLLDISNDKNYIYFASTDQSEHNVRIWEYKYDGYRFLEQVTSENNIEFISTLEKDFLFLFDTHGGIWAHKVLEKNHFIPIFHVCSNITSMDVCDDALICVATDSNLIELIDPKKEIHQRVLYAWVFTGSGNAISSEPHFDIKGVHDYTISNYSDKLNVIKRIPRDSGAIIIIGTRRGYLLIFNEITGECEYFNKIGFEGTDEEFVSVSYSGNDMKYLAAVSSGNGIIIYILTRVETGNYKLIRKFIASSSLVILSKYFDSNCLFYCADMRINEFWIDHLESYITNIITDLKLNILQSFLKKNIIYLVTGGTDKILRVWKRESAGQYKEVASFYCENELVACRLIDRKKSLHIACGCSGGEIYILHLVGLEA